MLRTWRSLLGTRVAAPLAVLLALGVLVTNEFAARIDADLVARREASVESRLTVGRLRRLVLTMESAERGFLLTGRAEYREPYDQANAQTAPALQAVRALAERTPNQRQNLMQLADAAEKKLSEVAEVMRLADAGERERALQLMLTDIGREQMERIDGLVEGVVAREDAAFARAGRQREALRLWTQAALVGLVLLCAGAALAAMRTAREHERERLRHLRDLQAERDKLEGEVERRTRDLSALAQHLQTVREDERRRLARELHDELGGLLTAAKLDVARVRKRLQGAAPEVHERIGHLAQTLDAGIALKRRIIEDLSPSSLANLGLARTLEIHCAEFGERAEIQVQARIAEVALSEERQLAVFRFVQEALTNVAKYARARRVEVSLALESGGDPNDEPPDEPLDEPPIEPAGENAGRPKVQHVAQPEAQPRYVRVQVHDDGIGFDPTQVRAGAQGLAGMRFRIESCGGHWLLQSAPGQGTLVQARLPALSSS